jgi:hypothetical protein
MPISPFGFAKRRYWFVVWVHLIGRFRPLGRLTSFFREKRSKQEKARPIAHPAGALRLSKFNENAAELACGSNSPR